MARVARASILLDKSHVMGHFGEALDRVRKAEYARLNGADRRYSKGQKRTLPSRRENLSQAGAQAPARRHKRLKHRLSAEGELWPALGALASSGSG
jgi:transposase